ncbi:hypothetical protein [Myxococcus sp. AM010]|uniref:hypothetical protein n=1 Tax=Myxococcus sp. AM010 TaxID=2745138 RepID=UPI0020D06B3A|nr:hypothetical protein [Myxococcus sp. AM010]
MTILLAVAVLVLAVVLFVVCRRLQDAEYWRAHWRRRHDERDAELSAALSEGQECMANVEHALHILWRRVEVVTPAEGAAVAVLRAAFPSLPAAPGPRIPAHVSAAVDALNTALAADPAAIVELLAVRVPCNEALASHPSVQVRRDDTGDSLGVLGLLNGCIGTIPSGPREGWGWVTLLMDDGAPLRFEVTAADVGSSDARPLCPTCSDKYCLAPGRCDDPSFFFGGDAP